MKEGKNMIFSGNQFGMGGRQAPGQELSRGAPLSVDNCRD
jgi:hypothetical protein